MPGPGSGANFNVRSETTTFNAYTQFPFVELRVILKKRTIQQKAYIGCHVMSKGNSSHRTWTRTVSCREWPAAQMNSQWLQQHAQDQWKFKPDKMAAWKREVGKNSCLWLRSYWQVIAVRKGTVSFLHGCGPGSEDKAPVNATHPRAYRQQKLHLKYQKLSSA